MFFSIPDFSVSVLSSNMDVPPNIVHIVYVSRAQGIDRHGDGS